MSKNYLIKATSPYLQQHAHNPVEWYPWGQAALNKARLEDKPILLSIGYSACHWCHVMAEESFEDQETAAIMNQYFINIKVDREERPDLDKIYQLSFQLLMGQGGGWPLTVFLTPDDQMPFFAGTYFPKEPRYGIPSFKEILLQIVDTFKKNRHEINSQNIQMRLALIQLDKMPIDNDLILNDEPIWKAREALLEQYDAVHGGFGTAPKFPNTMNLNFLLDHYEHHSRYLEDFSICLYSLDKMAAGGIYDQLAGGFFRYSVDNHWEIPHFEKMLYDNALLLQIYVNAFCKTKNIQYANIASAIGHWVIKEMQQAGGGYYSTLDADSEHHEGKYYYWDREHVRSLLDDDEYQLVVYLYGFDQAPNFELHWHLHEQKTLEETATYLKLSENKANQLLKSAKEKLLKTREQRIRPHRDEKILTAWNALMIKSMIIAGFHLGDHGLMASSLNTFDFIIHHLWKKKRLFASFKDNKVELPAYLDDYAFLLETCLTVLQYEWKTEYLDFAIKLADQLLEYFYDEENGGFFFTASDHEMLIQRPKLWQDEAIPAGNAIATLALIRLGHLLGETRYLNAAESTLKAAWSLLSRFPSAHTSLLTALQAYLQPPTIVMIRGTDEIELKTWRDKVLTDFKFNQLVFAIPDPLSKLPKIFNDYQSINGKTTAYVCKGTQCLAPVTESANLILNR